MIVWCTTHTRPPSANMFQITTIDSNPKSIADRRIAARFACSDSTLGESTLDSEPSPKRR